VCVSFHCLTFRPLRFASPRLHFGDAICAPPISVRNGMPMCARFAFRHGADAGG
jgi:hypothetical protein